ncbi:HAD hydrolase-like protein [Deinococcus saxicola]|uniref:HAD hydrolase-like protein n=1 Tax=Deinococcus saxicola TaxID=249406 RepID=UPI0039EDF2A3
MAEIIPLTRVTLGHALQMLAARLCVEEDALWRAHGALNLVVTHRDREGAIARLQAAGLWPLVDDLIGVSDGYPRKPDPAMFLVALRHHAPKPAACLTVVDRELDVRAAHAAGMPADLLITPDAELAVKAEFMLPDLPALLGVLNTDSPT